MFTNSENWKQIEMAPNYEVSDQGRIRNKKTGRILAQRLHRGYMNVALFNNGRRIYQLVHRLVAIAFLPVPDSADKREVNHIDEDKTNNNISNLEWVTRLENCRYGTRIERMVQSKKERGSASRKIICIETGVEYPSVSAASRELGICKSSLYRVINGEQKTAGGYTFKEVL